MLVTYGISVHQSFRTFSGVRTYHKVGSIRLWWVGIAHTELLMEGR